MSIGNVSGGNPPNTNADEPTGPADSHLTETPAKIEPMDPIMASTIIMVGPSSIPQKGRLGRKYGWRHQLLDARDHRFSSARKQGDMPPMKNLHSLCKTVFDQGQQGSCTANATVQAMMMTMTIERKAQVVLSRDFLYYNTRLMEGDAGSDAGAIPRDAMQSAATTGVVPESMWPYDDANLLTPPDPSLYAQSGKHRIGSYLAVDQSLVAMQQCIAAGYPFTFGFSVYDSFESPAVADSGNAPLPNLNTESLLGGHDVVAIGYNNGPDQHHTDGKVWPTGTMLCQNSWGPGWGLMSGCFTIPYSYLTNLNLASDFWTIRLDT